MKFSIRIIIYLVLLAVNIIPCTTAIISGSATKDGRPLLFKHRDSDYFDNKLMFFNDAKFSFIGLINTKDVSGKEVWAGINSEGFCIMNSASYNLKGNDTTSLVDNEGVLMKAALGNCASVEEFERFLSLYAKPLGVEANFGVIDALGNAAYFETDNFKFTKFDVNDPKVAPNGYLIRSNYSFNGFKDQGYGYIRYSSANELLEFADGSNIISVKYIFQNVSRSLKHSLTKDDLSANLSPDFNTPKMSFFEDFIPRYSSCASFVAEGVKKGESPEFTTMWTILGFPLTSVAVPVWIKGDSQLPEIVTSINEGTPAICSYSLKLKELCFPIKRGSGKRYINTAVLKNQAGTGIIQKLLPLENKIIDETCKKMNEWRSGTMQKSEILKFYSWLDKTVKEGYSSAFGF